MKDRNNDSAKLNYNVIPFYFEWSWIKDKTILHKGGDRSGALIIIDEDGIPVKMWGYELIANEKE